MKKIYIIIIKHNIEKNFNKFLIDTERIQCNLIKIEPNLTILT